MSIWQRHGSNSKMKEKKCLALHFHFWDKTKGGVFCTAGTALARPLLCTSPEKMAALFPARLIKSLSVTSLPATSLHEVASATHPKGLSLSLYIFIHTSFILLLSYVRGSILFSYVTTQVKISETLLLYINFKVKLPSTLSGSIKM